MAPTAAGLPLMLAMRERYPDVRLHLAESLSGYLTDMLNARRLDLAVLFKADEARRWSVMPLLQERLFVIGAATLPGLVAGGRIRLSSLAALPLILPSGPHGLRSALDAAWCPSSRRVNPLQLGALALERGAAYSA